MSVSVITIAISFTLAVCSFISSVLTVVLNNRYLLKVKRMELQQKEMELSKICRTIHCSSRFIYGERIWNILLFGLDIPSTWIASRVNRIKCCHYGTRSEKGNKIIRRFSTIYNWTIKKTVSIAQIPITWMKKLPQVSSKDFATLYIKAEANNPIIQSNPTATTNIILCVILSPFWCRIPTPSKSDILHLFVHTINYLSKLHSLHQQRNLSRYVERIFSSGSKFR